VWYEVKVLENLEVRVEKDNTTFDIRIGWSTDDSGMMLGKLRVTCYQCCGSGIRCLFYPGSGMGKESGSGIRMNNPDHISESLETISWVKNLKYFNSLMRIRDKHPRSTTLRVTYSESVKLIWYGFG
jgi:hypothetical protein